MEATGDQVPSPIASFEEAQLPPALAANTIRCKYTKPTPVQKYSIPIGLARRDLMACAQTGSGKTAAFCFPIIGNILVSGTQPTGRSRKVRGLRSLKCSVSLSLLLTGPCVGAQSLCCGVAAHLHPHADALAAGDQELCSLLHEIRT